MSKHSDLDVDLEALREKIIGLGERSFRKSYYPRLRQQLLHLQRFRVLLDQSSDAIFLLKLPAGRLVDVNESAARQLGYARERLLSMSLGELAGPENPSPLDFLPPGAATGGPGKKTLNLSLRKSNGEHLPVEITVRLVVFGGVLYAVAAARDVTTRQRLEEELREGERRCRELIESLPQLIWTTDGKGACDFLSRQWVAYTGIPAEKQLGTQWLQAVHPDDRQRCRELWHRFVQNQGSYDLEYRLQRADGQYRWFKTRGVPFRDRQGRISKIFGSCTEIDAQIRAEDSLRRVSDELQRSNQDLEQFAYIISHDLREPLRTIAGFLNLVRKRYQDKLDSEGVEFISFAVDGANRMDLMIRDLLEYSRIQRKEFTRRPVPLFDVWLAAVENLYALIEETGARITHDPLPIVSGSESLLVRLLQNLLANAIAYCRNRQPVIHLGVQPREGRWLLALRDNGIGISPEHQSRIFQIFHRLHSQDEYPGTGMGLAICLKIVERHGGRIWVESEPGAGSTFYFDLPRAE